MGGQYHIGSVVRNDCVGMGCSTIEKLMYLVHGVLCRHGLLCRNGSKFREQCGINASGVLETVPVTSWKNFFCVGVRIGEGSASVAYCALAPYVGLTWG